MRLEEVLGESRGKEVAEEMGSIMEQIKSLGYKELRSWNEFFAVLKPPSSWSYKNVEQRLLTNLVHYRSNYLAICAILFGIRILFAPYILLALICVITFGVYLLVIVNKPILVGEFTVDDRLKRVIVGSVTLVFLALCGALERLLWTTIYCIVICGLHMIFRPRSVTSKTGKPYDEIKLSGFSWFGVSPTDDSRSSADPEAPEDSSERDNSIHAGITSASMVKRTGRRNTPPQQTGM
jgi:PRA1 family protein